MCAVEMMHYVRPTNPPSRTLTNNNGESLVMVSKTSEAVARALTSDVSGIVHVLNNTISLYPVLDYDHLQGIATPFIFDPLTDSPPATWYDIHAYIR